jgi:hypothetical protein
LCQGTYIPLAGFAEDNLIISKSYAVAYYHGQSAGHFSGSQQASPVKDFPMIEAAQEFYVTASLSTAIRPSLVLHLTQQLNLLDLLEKQDSDLAPYRQVKISNYNVGEFTTMLVESTQHDS